MIVGYVSAVRVHSGGASIFLVEAVAATLGVEGRRYFAAAPPGCAPVGRSPAETPHDHSARVADGQGPRELGLSADHRGVGQPGHHGGSGNPGDAVFTHEPCHSATAD